jgi:hypothetical protein
LLSDSKSELLGLFNSGYGRNGKSHRLIGDNYELREFSTFCPLVYGMIGKPIDSFNSRSIPIEMRRATPAEWRTLRSLEDGEEEDHRLLAMGRKAARWVADNLDRLKAAKPNMGSMTNRPATNWKPLFAIAEVAGGEWPARARAAAGVAAKLKQMPVDEEELFTVIKAALATSTKDYIESDSLARKLVEVEDGPWAEYGKTGKPITTNALARLLRRFGIGPGYVGPEAARRRGYTRVQFEEVFASYVADPTRIDPPKYDDSNCAGVQNAMDAAQVEPRNCAATVLRHTPAAQLEDARNPTTTAFCTDARLQSRKIGVEGVSLGDDLPAPAKVEQSDDLPEFAAEAPPTAAGGRPEPIDHRRFAGPMPPRTQIVPAANGHAAADPWDAVGPIPTFLDRNRPRLGPPAISSGPDDDLADFEM